MIQSIASLALKIFGWNASASVPVPDKCILIGAPHTTNWDFPWTLLGLASMGVRFNWVAKHTLFFWPLGPLLRAIGGIAVDRSQGASFLIRCIDLYNSRQKLILAIAPEGTRSKTKYWKTGFYTIAQRADVPIGLGFIDYPSKTIGIDKILHPSDDIDHDFEIISNYYQGKRGKYPENQGEVTIKRKKRSARNSES